MSLYKFLWEPSWYKTEGEDKNESIITYNTTSKMI